MTPEARNHVARSYQELYRVFDLYRNDISTADYLDLYGDIGIAATWAINDDKDANECARYMFDALDKYFFRFPERVYEALHNAIAMNRWRITTFVQPPACLKNSESVCNVCSGLCKKETAPPVSTTPVACEGCWADACHVCVHATAGGKEVAGNA